MPRLASGAVAEMQQIGAFIRFWPGGPFPAAFRRCFPAIVVSGEDGEAIRASDRA
jgi:hypothetical protein